MHYITLKLKDFSAAHRLIKSYTGKCRNLHGHNYAVTVTVTAKTLDESDCIIDFKKLKILFNNWLQTHWDHATLVCELDQPLLDFLQVQQQQYFVMPDAKNTTVENLAAYLHEKFTGMLDDSQQISTHNITIAEIKVAETSSSLAGYAI